MVFCPPEAYGLLGKDDINTNKKDRDYKPHTRIKKIFTNREKREWSSAFMGRLDKNCSIGNLAFGSKMARKF